MANQIDLEISKKLTETQLGESLDQLIIELNQKAQKQFETNVPLHAPDMRKHVQQFTAFVAQAQLDFRQALKDVKDLEEYELLRKEIDALYKRVEGIKENISLAKIGEAYLLTESGLKEISNNNWNPEITPLQKEARDFSQALSAYQTAKGLLDMTLKSKLDPEPDALEEHLDARGLLAPSELGPIEKHLHALAKELLQDAENQKKRILTLYQEGKIENVIEQLQEITQTLNAAATALEDPNNPEALKNFQEIYQHMPKNKAWTNNEAWAIAFIACLTIIALIAVTAVCLYTFGVVPLGVAAAIGLSHLITSVVIPSVMPALTHLAALALPAVQNFGTMLYGWFASEKVPLFLGLAVKKTMELGGIGVGVFMKLSYPAKLIIGVAAGVVSGFLGYKAGEKLMQRYHQDKEEPKAESTASNEPNEENRDSLTLSEDSDISDVSSNRSSDSTVFPNLEEKNEDFNNEPVSVSSKDDEKDSLENSSQRDMKEELNALREQKKSPGLPEDKNDEKTLKP